MNKLIIFLMVKVRTCLTNCYMNHSLKKLFFIEFSLFCSFSTFVFRFPQNKTPLLLVLIVWLSIPAVVCVLFLLFAIVCVIIDVIHGPYTGGDVPGNAIGRFFEGIMYAVFLGSGIIMTIYHLMKHFYRHFHFFI